MELIPNSAIGTFNYAHSFWRAGIALGTADWQKHETHPGSPVEFLLWHAIELFLKSFLLADGLSEQVLRSRAYGHNLTALTEEAKKRGLPLTKRDEEVLSLMPTTDDMIELRYLTVGIKTVPEIEEVEETCKSLYRLVAIALTHRGIAVRFYREET